MQIPIISGIGADAYGHWRSRYVLNLVPTPKDTAISKGYLAPAPGIVKKGDGPGIGRGGITWNDVLYRVMGPKLVRINEDGQVVTLGVVEGSEPVTLDYSFDKLGIVSAGRLYYWDGTALKQVTDEDLGKVNDAVWIAGYWLTTDGKNLIVTELDDPFAVTTTKYGSAESDPDDILAVDKLRNEAYAFGRYTIEVFQNVGGTNFPFARIEGAQVPKGIVGTHAYAQLLDTFAFVGSARNEAPGVYVMAPGQATKISTQEIDKVLGGYTEAELRGCIVESRASDNHQFLYIHLPDQSICFDASAAAAVGEPVWFHLSSALDGNSQYRARHFVWAYNAWHCEDPTSTAVGVLSQSVSSHYGDTVGWSFSTAVMYNEGNDGIIHELELVALPGRNALGDDPSIWTSYSLDGETWSQERSIQAGKQGDRLKRLVWRTQGRITHYRIQRFRGTSDAHLSISRLEASIEPLFPKGR